MNELSKTKSLCPECLKTLDATIFEEDNKVFIKKNCPEHGECVEVYWEDYDMYKRAQKWAHDGEGIANPNVEKKEPCPNNCGLCSEHKSHTCLGNIVVTNRCDLACWYCFFFASKMGYVYEPTLDQIRMMLRKMREEKPVACKAVQFSLDANEKIIVKSPAGMIYSENIGDFVDNMMSIKKPSISQHPIYHERTDINDWEVMSVDNDKNSVFKPIKSVIRHENSEDLFEITTSYGWKITTTGAHSVFVMTDNGDVVAKEASKLKKDDILLGNLSVPNNRAITEIDLIEIIKERASRFIDKIRICDLSSDEKRYYDKLSKRKKIVNWDSVGLPEHIKSERKYGGFIRYFNSRKEKKLPIKMKITPELCRLLGYYVGEGCCYKNGIIFSFGLKEDKIINDFKNCLKTVLGDIHCREIPNYANNEIQIYIEGYLYKLFFSIIMGAGKMAVEKRAPWVIYNVDNELKKEFLKAYFDCDGNKRERIGEIRNRFDSFEIDHNTASRSLASDLISLHLQLDIVPRMEVSLTKPHLIKKTGQYLSKTSTKYKIIISGKNSLSKALWYLNDDERESFEKYINRKGRRIEVYQRLPITDEILKLSANKVCDSRIKYLFNRIEWDKSVAKQNIKEITDYFDSERIDFNRNFNDISHCNLGIFKIRNIKKVKSSSKYVYDISVPNTEAFFAGTGQLLAHNTGGNPEVREDLIDIIKIAKEEGYIHIQPNINGTHKLWKDPQFAKDMRSAGSNNIYLSFDGTTPKTNPKNHWEIPYIIKNCKDAGLSIVLVPTVIKGFNDGDLGNIIRFGIKNTDIVRAINFQPVSLVGRMPRNEREKSRITIPGAIKKIEEQTNGMIVRDDWYPVPIVTGVTRIVEAMKGIKKHQLSPHFACGMSTFVYKDGDEIVPLPRFIDIDGLGNYLNEKADEIDSGQNRLFTAAKIVAKIGTFIDKEKQPKDLDIFNIFKDIIMNKGNYRSVGNLMHKVQMLGMMHFQDLYNYDIERTKRCVIHYAQPDGTIVPFCAFNVIPELYRDKVQRKFSMTIPEWEAKNGKKLTDSLYKRDVEKLASTELYKKAYKGFI